MKYLITFIIFLCFSSENTASTLGFPRAWLVQKDNHKAILVGESHFYSKLEFDGYFQSVVRPLVFDSRAGMFEFYHFRIDGNEWSKNCPSEQNGQFAKSEKLLTAMTHYLDIVSPATKAMNRQIAVARLYVPGFTIEAALNGELSNKMKIYFVSNSNYSFDGVATSLARDIENTRGVDYFHDLDNAKIQWSAFCRANFDDQVAYLHSVIETTIVRTTLLKDPLTPEKYQQFLLSTERALLSGLKCIDKELVCDVAELSFIPHIVPNGGGIYTDSDLLIRVSFRNQLWITKIIDLLQKETPLAIIVGSSHLPDLKIKGKKEFGLISLLRNAGCSVTPILEREEARYW